MSKPIEIEVFHMIPRDYKLNWGSMKLIQDSAVDYPVGKFYVCCTPGSGSSLQSKIGCWIAYNPADEYKDVMSVMRNHILGFSTIHSFGIIGPMLEPIPRNPENGLPVIMIFNDEMTIAK